MFKWYGTTYNGNIAIFEGSTAKDYQPYTGASYPINLGSMELNKISTYQDYIFKSSGKNLFDGQIELGNISTSTGENVDSTTQIRSKNYIAVEPNTSYKLAKNGSGYSVIFLQYDKNKTFITSTTTASNNYLTTSSNCYYIKWKPYTATTDLTGLYQINKGTSILPYEPYGTDWYKYSAIGTLTLDGTETWTDYTTQYTGYYTSYTTSKHTNSITTASNSLCNYFTVLNVSGSSFSSNVDFVGTNQNAIYIKINNNIATSSQTLKTWLGTNKPVVFYPLATPTYDKITDTTLSSQLEAVKKSYDTQTNISQTNNDLPFELSVTALGELNG